VPASVGFIAVWGVAILNGVVLVSFIKELREQGLTVQEAVKTSCEARFRPVLITAAATILGLAPFLISTGLGSEVQRPLAIVVICGLITATVMTKVVVPMMYRWFDDHKDDAPPSVPNPPATVASAVTSDDRHGGTAATTGETPAQPST
jgi:cobalt-zinc-cadmium resistance protein CzcA